MKIVYLTNNINPKEGWGRYATDLILGVERMGHEVVILKEKNDGYRGIQILKRGAGLFVSAIKIIKYLKDCDIIHALDVYPYGIIVWIANIFLRKKMIITVQGTYSIAPFYNFKTKYLAKMACSRADLIIAISNYTKDELLKNTSVKKIEIVNHGIDLQKFYLERKVSDDEYILSVGSIKPRKGYHVSIPAFSLVRKNNPNLKYKIIGSYKDKNYFEKIKGVDGVELLNNISDDELKDIYSKARLFILTSINSHHHFEGFGLVFLEAAAAGLPVIGTLNNGITDAVRDGYNGILVPQNDIKKTAEAIISIISDSQKSKKMSDESYAWAREHNISDVLDKYGRIYQNV